MRVSGLARKPILCRVAAGATKEDLQCLRGAGAIVLLTEGTAADVSGLKETVASLPPRRPRREERTVVSLPRRAAAEANGDDDDDD
jgi:hypothetical protein